jgi:undecaprenyl-diphosphatase
MLFPNWAKNILFLLVYMISGLVLAVIIGGLLTGTELLPLNIVVEQAVVMVRTPLLTTLFVAISRLGDPYLLSLTTIVIATVLIRHGRLYDAVLLVVSLLVALVSLVVLKNTFQISRPGVGIVDAVGWSFPSGHATTATSFFFMLIYTFVNRLKTLAGKIILIFGSVLAAILISFSRLYLGAHWTLDILGGIALGLLSVSFAILIFNIFIDGRRSLKNRIS